MGEWATAHGAEVDGGQEAAFLTPEGPMTHFGHMLTDSVLPLFSTTILLHSDDFYMGHFRLFYYLLAIGLSNLILRVTCALVPQT